MAFLNADPGSLPGEKGEIDMSGKRIVCAGHVCIDITPAVPDLKGTRIDEMLSPGKLVQVGRASLSVGGCVSNTGLGLKVLGANVSLMGKIGKDAFGELILNEFRRYGAQEGLIVSEEDANPRNRPDLSASSGGK